MRSQCAMAGAGIVASADCEALATLVLRQSSRGIKIVPIVIPLLIVALVFALPYAVYRAMRKWGLAFLYLLVAGICFVGASGVLAEHLWGPQWSWNFAH